MRYTKVLIFILAIVFMPGIVAAQESNLTPEMFILSLEEIWNQAHLHGDVDVLDHLWATDITVVVPEMPVLTKPELLRMWRSMKLKFTRYETSDVRVKVFGATVVVTGRLERSRNFGGKVKSEDWLFTKTYALTEGEWKVVAYHASPRPTS